MLGACAVSAGCFCRCGWAEAVCGVVVGPGPLSDGSSGTPRSRSSRSLRRWPLHRWARCGRGFALRRPGGFCGVVTDCGTSDSGRNAERTIGEAGMPARTLTWADSTSLERRSGTDEEGERRSGDAGGRGFRGPAEGTQGAVGAQLRGACRETARQHLDAAPVLQRGRRTQRVRTGGATGEAVRSEAGRTGGAASAVDRRRCGETTPDTGTGTDTGTDTGTADTGTSEGAAAAAVDGRGRGGS